MVKRRLFVLVQMAPALLALLAWEALVRNRPERSFSLGSPSGIVREAKAVALDEGTLLSDYVLTASEAVGGFLAGTALGSALGLGLWASRFAYLVARPYLITLSAVPVFALGPVLIFWLGTGPASKLALAFLTTFVIAVIQAYSGAQEADPQLLRMTRAFGGNRWHEFSRIVVPTAGIWVLAGVRLNISMALLGAVIGEFLSSRAGLGHMIIVAEGLYNVNRVWVGILAIASIALLFNGLTLPLERLANRWK